MQSIAYVVNNEGRAETANLECFVDHSLKTSSAENTTKLNQCTLDMEVLAVGDKSRGAVEQFIKQGFAKAYGANIAVNAPWLLAIKEGKYKAALGIRSALSPLFVEQYLQGAIENYVSEQGCLVARAEIAEIGNLYSNAKRFTLPLFLVAAVSLFCNNYRYMVFSGTSHVLNLMNKIGVEHRYIADADPRKLAASNDDWGTYYDTQPKVVSVSLASVMRVIESNTFYLALFTQLSDRISKTTSRLKGDI